MNDKEIKIRREAWENHKKGLEATGQAFVDHITRDSQVELIAKMANGSEVLEYWFEVDDNWIPTLALVVRSGGGRIFRYHKYKSSDGKWK